MCWLSIKFQSSVFLALFKLAIATIKLTDKTCMHLKHWYFVSMKGLGENRSRHKYTCSFHSLSALPCAMFVTRLSPQAVQLHAFVNFHACMFPCTTSTDNYIAKLYMIYSYIVSYIYTVCRFEFTYTHACSIAMQLAIAIPIELYY